MEQWPFWLLLAWWWALGSLCLLVTQLVYSSWENEAASAGFSNSRTSGPLGSNRQTKLYRLQFLSWIQVCLSLTCLWNYPTAMLVLQTCLNLCKKNLYNIWYHNWTIIILHSHTIILNFGFHAAPRHSPKQANKQYSGSLVLCKVIHLAAWGLVDKNGPAWWY